MPDEFGARMKTYEQPTRQVLPPRTYTILRVDGRAFHTYLRNAEKPFDPRVIEAMDKTAQALCGEISGARFAYTQSDEISVLLTDLEPRTGPWFGGVVQKMASVAASIATATFNRYYDRVVPPAHDGWPLFSKYATFDGRVYTIPSRIEVANYFLWRQKDAIRNAVSMAAQAYVPHQDLQGMNVAAMQELLYQRRSLNFKTDFSDRERRGGGVVYEECTRQAPPAVEFTAPDGRVLTMGTDSIVRRHRWATQDVPDFTLDNGGFLALQIPQEPADALQPDGDADGLPQIQDDTGCAAENSEHISGGQQ